MDRLCNTCPSPAGWSLSIRVNSLPFVGCMEKFMNIKLIKNDDLRKRFNELQRNHDDPLFRFLVENIFHSEPLDNSDDHYPNIVWQAAHKAAFLLGVAHAPYDDVYAWSKKGHHNSKAVQDAYFWMMDNRFKEGKMVKWKEPPE